jgi:hypothetical protein
LPAVVRFRVAPASKFHQAAKHNTLALWHHLSSAGSVNFFRATHRWRACGASRVHGCPRLDPAQAYAMLDAMSALSTTCTFTFDEFCCGRVPVRSSGIASTLPFADTNPSC